MASWIIFLLQDYMQYIMQYTTEYAENEVDKKQIYRDHIFHLKDSQVCLRDDYTSRNNSLIDNVIDVF